MINKKPLFSFIIWTFTFIFICLIGISNVFALENGGAIRFYDNNGSSLSYVTTDYIQQTDESSAVFTTTANSYGGGVMIQLPTPLIQNHIYTLFVNVAAANMGGFTKPSTKNCIGIGNGYTDTINSYVNCSISPKYTQESGVTADKRNGLYFTFIANTNASYVLIAYTSDNTCTNCLQYSYGYNISDGGDTSGLSQTQVNNIINQQTTTIQNDIYDMQQAVAGSIDDLSETLTENQKVCTVYDRNNIFTDKYYLNSSGVVSGQDTSAGITDYINIYNGSVEVLNPITYNTGYSTCFYNINKSLLSCVTNNNFTNPVSIPNNAYYIRATINKGNNLPTFKVCHNGNQVINDSINGLNDSINNDDIDDNGIGNAFDSFNDYLDDNSTITQLITLPITLYTAILNNLNGTCSPFNLGQLYGEDLILPCINISQYLGNSLWTMIDIIISGFAVYAISKKMIKVFNNFSSLREGDVIDD